MSMIRVLSSRSLFRMTSSKQPCEKLSVWHTFTQYFPTPSWSSICWLPGTLRALYGSFSGVLTLHLSSFRLLIIQFGIGPAAGPDGLLMIRCKLM